MKNPDLKELLMSGARESGICRSGYDSMRSLPLDGLVDYYLENPDWCIERDFPAIDVLRSYFSDREEKGIFIDRDFDGELLSDRLVYVLHNCKGRISVGLNIDKGIIPMIYLANGCDITITGDGVRRMSPLRVPVYDSGDNRVSTDSDMASVCFTVHKIDRP